MKEYSYGRRLVRASLSSAIYAVVLIVAVAVFCAFALHTPPTVTWGLCSVAILVTLVGTVAELRRLRSIPQGFMIVGSNLRIRWSHGAELIPLDSLNLPMSTDPPVIPLEEDQGFSFEYGAGIKVQVLPKLDHYSEFRAFLWDAHARAREPQATDDGPDV